jgi:hypothetical protein
MTRLRAKHLRTREKKNPENKLRNINQAGKQKHPHLFNCCWYHHLPPLCFSIWNSTFWQCCRSTLILQSKLELVRWMQEYVKNRSYGQKTTMKSSSLLHIHHCLATLFKVYNSFNLVNPSKCIPGTAFSLLNYESSFLFSLQQLHL